MTSGAQMLRGFDRVERSVRAWRGMIVGTALGEAVERLFPGSDERLATKALAWMERQSGPFFLYIQLMDSHTPYRFPPLDGRRRAGRRIEFPATGMRMTPEEADSIRARYDGGVRSAQAQAARLLTALASRGRPFLAVITSDHGESLGEEGRWFHGRTLAPELLGVPLVVIGDSVERGEIFTPVGHAAIAPTLLAAASIPCLDCTRADLRRDAGPGTAEGGLPPRLAYRIGEGYKLVLDLETGRRALYDLRSDPAERRDIAALAPEVVKTLASGLSGDTRPPEIEPEHLERLRSLGYSGP
jgi:arylsulfatase A-like enzyme